VRIVDALPVIRSSRFDLPLTYDCGELNLRVGDVVRVPLGSRDVVAFVVSDVRDAPPDPKLRTVEQLLDTGRAFDALGLRLAKFVAEHYLCTLGEALGSIVLSGAVPRTVDSLTKTVSQPNPERYPSVPARLVRLIWEDLPESFAVESLLRHPAARRTGDRGALLRNLQALVRAGVLRRERRIVEPKTQPYRVRVLHPRDGGVRGKKAIALAEFVRAQPGVARAEAVLAGFSNAVIARAVKAGAIDEREIEPAHVRERSEIAGAPMPPTEEQRAALAHICTWLDAGTYHEDLLFGVTGSGKTYVYVEAIKHVVRAGGRAIVLVPEISLTPQTARRFEDVFGERVAVLHSALSERERFDAWRACMQGEIDVAVGARSAVFAPLENVRLLIVDEAHESSYKQESVPRYQAVAVARERIRLTQGLLLLGSATPSLESYEAARRGKVELLTRRERATAAALPHVHIVDLSKEFAAGNRRIFSSALVEGLQRRLSAGEKTVLFVNRRGSGGFMLCRSCGFVPECPRCDVSLAAHRSEGLLRCHYCDYQTPIPARCPRCGMPAIKEFGVGTERVAEEVGRLFPDARVLRMDSDTTTRVGDHARLLSGFETGGDVLVGTQMVAKGLDFPSVTLVGVVAADLGLHVPDFRAAERTFDLVAQVCGRSGRMRAGEAIVQTYAPDHPAIAFAARHDYEGFAAHELEERRALQYPPFARLLYLGIIGRSRARVWETAKRYTAIAQEAQIAEVLGPAPYPVARMNNEWRVRIALKTRKPRDVRSMLRESILPLSRLDRQTRLAINVDP
jgi:primosomal protein N' (replication factor Y) (superfamily II helicase)